MTERKGICITALIWGLGIALILLIYRENALPVALSGIRINGGSEGIGLLTFSRWLCLLLPLYVSIGFDLHRHKQSRSYLLVRCQSYARWWRRWCRMILVQAALYFICLGAAWQLWLSPEKSMVTTVLVHIISSGVFLLLFLLLWEIFLFDGGVPILCFAQFVLIYGASFLSESARHLILPYLGMSYRLNGQKELMVFVGSEIILIVALILAVPKWIAGKVKR